MQKITCGFVVQRWDEAGKFLGQEFVAGDEVEYEDDNGNMINPDEIDNFFEKYSYRCFTMDQMPEAGSAFTGE